MLPVGIKKLSILSAISIGISACGGGGSDSKNTQPPTPVPTPNNAPIISSFTAQASTNNTLEYTYAWSVSDSDNDTLSCTLIKGDGSADIIINDCANNSSSVASYQAAGEFSASLTVSDPSNASDSDLIALNVADNSNELPEPVVSAETDELVIFYKRADNNYTDWIVHLWNNDSCDAYANGDTEWATGQAQSGIDPNYGAYWVIDLKTEHDTCANFIVHKGDDKDLGGIDHQTDLTGERMIWSLSGISELYSEPTSYPSGVLIQDTAAHWANENTVFWNTPSETSSVRIYSADNDDLAYDSENGISGDNYLEYIADSSAEHPAEKLGLARYEALTAFSSTNASVEKAKEMLTGKLLAIAYGSDDTILAATYVQSPRILDALYTSGNDDANEKPLGIIYDGNSISANVWAPTAQQVKLKIYDANKALQSTEDMTVDTSTGIWTFSGDNTLDRAFYRYELTVYHPLNQKFETIDATDPYSVSLATNGEYSQFVNLSDDDLKPSNWDEHAIPTIDNPEDAIIYEGHIRDFSVSDSSTTEENRGKYLAFTEETSAPVTHLKSLVDAGLTHFQFLPANDIASINEDLENSVNLSNTVAELCAANSTAPVCGVENNTAILSDVLASYAPTSNNAQALVQSMRGLDSFNWGYDPEHFTAPDGSYASNPDGVARIKEMRAMNQSLHEMGLRVVLDVVYNHTNSSGLWEDSVLDKVVPGYYHRRNLISGDVETSTCCQDTAPEHEMMHKLMQDSLITWTQAYKFDGFRFDIMSNNSSESILAAREAVQAIDADNYFYGEGWTRDERGYVQANQANMAGTEVGTFNDRPRDIIRSASLFSANGTLNDQDIIRLGLIGTIADYQLKDKNNIVKLASTFSKPSYAQDPADIINYVSKHDNETLWDQLQYGIEPGVSVANRVRMQNIAGTLPLVSQGITFLQLGGDLIRSKSMDRNTYDAGDWFNKVDFTKTSNNWNVGLPLAQDNESKWNTIGSLINNSETAVSAADITFSGDIFKEFMSLRRSSPLFRLTTKQDIIERVGFHNTGPSQTQGVIVMSIDDGTGLTDLDANNDALVVVINGSTEQQALTVNTAADFELHSIQQNSADNTVKSANFTANAESGTFTVPALTTAVFVKPQGASQGAGLAADATSNAPDATPFGDVEVYLRGSMNNWGNDGLNTSDQFIYDSNGIYELNFTLDAGTYQFKIADNAWDAVNLGYSDLTFANGSISISDNGGNLEMTIATAGNYGFTLNASTAIPELNIASKNETVDCDALADSSDPIPFDITGGGQLYVRGDHSGWNAEEAYRLHYKGNNQYQAVADFDGAMQFKLASDDGSWTTQLWAQASNSNDLLDSNLEVGVSYPVAFNDAGQSNNNTTLPAGSYSFLLTLESDNPAKGFNVGDIIIQQCQ
ncbi:alpha-1,6-glucosidase domain-containing protein [Cognaticolwellia mytili]|uniref:alpha-1,6-glucosidase domain-containing protein n=1 Tax=Cognaticolwellia mytili TaxID=1888913 RepID=UPI000A175A6E|nr:alpha-1,6-glucosidase domain-containing protein [Cognaticolwellia mytili]